MARGRMIQRKTGKNEALQNVLEEFGAYAVILHHRLLAFTDRNGNVRADGFSLKANVFPIADNIKPRSCERFLNGLAKFGLVKLYTIGRVPYANFPAFSENQGGLSYNKEKDEHPLAPWQITGKNPGEIPEKIQRQSELESESEEEDKKPPLIPPLPKTAVIDKPKDRRAEAERFINNLVESKRAKVTYPQPKPGSLSAEVVEKTLAICKTAGVSEKDKARVFHTCKTIAAKHGPAVLDRINGNLKESLATGNITNPLALAFHMLNEVANAP